jgi:hypothetical protein
MSPLTAWACLSLRYLSSYPAWLCRLYYACSMRLYAGYIREANALKMFRVDLEEFL